MTRYILRRCLSMVFIILATAFVIFTILYFTPGDPARQLLGSSATNAEVAAYREQLGLNQPYLVQLGQYFYNTFIRFDFGISWLYHVPVFDELLTRMPRTLIIGLSAMVLNLVIGLALGIFAGTHEGRWQDSTSMSVAMLFISAPDFWVALMMIVLFSKILGWLPAYGIGGPQYYIMPIICAALPGIAVNARQARSSILEVFREDFVTTARAKGQREDVVVRAHMLPNALTPIITSVGSGFSRIVAGAPVIETVFAIPGVGVYMLSAINARDYPAVRASVLFFAVFTAVAMLVVDLAYAFVDPRIKARYSGGGTRKKKALRIPAPARLQEVKA
ncbi:MAG: ABC transporter permease [Propionicimonas sp.]|uniref:ABC transporter permease n=1 Tax=Propionicimonas sp. TaxID=1955623 RepID=UPI003D11DC47